MEAYLDPQRSIIIAIIHGLLAFLVLVFLGGGLLVIDGLFTLLIFMLIMASILVGLSYSFISKFGLSDFEEPVLIMDEQGVWDRRIFTKPIPWEGLDWQYWDLKVNPFIVINLESSFDEYFKYKNPAFKVINQLGKYIGPGGQRIDLLPLSVPPADVCDEFHRYKPLEEAEDEVLKEDKGLNA